MHCCRPAQLVGLVDFRNTAVKFFILGLILGSISGALGADKNGVSPNTISLPKGPGSIEGLGESFQPNLNTGTAKYAIGFKVPPGTAGHAPALGLSYEGGGGNGPVGYGWSLPMACIQRRTDHGIPTYGQDVGFPRQDAFINELKEELVPQTNGYFFCQNEGAFIRYQPVGDHWEGTLPNGTRLEFGLSENSRIQNATNNSVFSWLLEREVDTHGNAILYTYSSFQGETNLNQKYLSVIRYGPGAPPWSSYHFVSLEYEDRPDWFEDCRAGFIVRTGKRLKTIRVGTQGVNLAGHLQGDFDGDGKPDYLDRAYQFAYLNYAGTNSHWSLLAKVTPLGADGVSNLPSSSFGYTAIEPPDIASATGLIIGGSNEPPAVMDNELVELVDLNGDGLPDLLKTDFGGGAHQGYMNRGEMQTDSGRVIRWDSGIDVDAGNGTAWNYNLSASDTHLADMDGDGLADLVHKTVLGDVIYFPNLGRVAWGGQQMMSVLDSAPPSPFGEQDVRTADLDFDKRIDVVQSVASGTGFAYRIWFNLGDQMYSPSVTVEQDAGFDFSDPSVQIADLNGDRVSDVARVLPVGVMVTAGLGYGHFASIQMMLLPDYTLNDTQIAHAKLTDLNGDGLADLVVERAAPAECWYWLNLGNYSFSARKVITGLPTTLGVNAVVRWADINGNGTTDLMYADGSSVPKIQSVDLGEVLGIGASPNTLVAISNGIGRVTLISYKPSTYFALADLAAGQPWTNVMPLTVTVVAGVSNLDSLGHAYVTQFRYHDGYYDSVEKQFRGFERVEQLDIGDGTAPTLVSRSYFDTGREYEAMKGKVLRLTLEQADGNVFSDAVTTWTIPPVVLMVGTNGTNVSYAHPVGKLTQIEELGQGTPRSLEQEFGYDTYGNQTRLADYGIVVNGDRTAFGDERIMTTEYAINTQAWLLRNPSRVEVADGNGTVLSRVENYYDDETFSGNNYGVISLGNLTLTRAWFNTLDPSGYIQSSRTKYDIYGNPITLLDPLAVAPGGAVDVSQGHARAIVYDGDFHAYPVTENVQVGNGSPDLAFQALYDQGFGVITSSTDFNSNTTSYGYDAFARLLNMVKPYDTADYPTLEYNYVLAVPYGANGLVNYIETRQLDKPANATGSNKRDRYLISRQFSDGLGRALMTRQEAEAAPGSSAPRVVVTGAVLFNARQKPSRTLNPYFTLKAGATLDDLLDYESIEEPGWRGAFHDKGQLVTLDLNNAHQATARYDAMLRPTANTNADGTFSRTVYEPLVTRIFDENDNDSASPFYNTPTVQYHDGLGRVIRTDELTHLNDDGTPTGDLKTWSTTYKYDVNDRLTQVTDSQGNAKSIFYDGLKRKTSMQDPDCGTITYTYDDASNLRKTVDAKAQEIDYTYDGVNRVRTEDYLDDNSAEFSYHRGPDVSYFYDQPAVSVDNGDGTRATAHNTKGVLAYVQDTSGEEHMSYDARGRVEWSIKRVPDALVQDLNSSSFPLVSYRTAFQYDSLDRVTTMIYPDNDQVSYEYNDRGLMGRIVGGPSGSILSNLVYAPSAQQQQIDYGNGVRTTYAYDNRQRLTSLLTFHATNASDQLINFSYTFDGVSNIKAIQDQRDTSLVSATDKRRNSQVFVYDDLYRLTRAQYNVPNPASVNGGEINYRYDRIGNMLTQTSDITQQEKGLPVADLGAMSYGGALSSSNRTGRQLGDPAGPHALSQITNPQSAITNRVYGYDANGNMTTIDGLKCTWDFKDRLVGVEDDTMRAEYRYDYTDRRIVKKVFWKQSELPPGALVTTEKTTTLDKLESISSASVRRTALPSTDNPRF
ncbi:MAG TPA: toxin TcdB middle/N-terminal domain-containing protein [Candidatus Limnocylindrales bacterium]|nr:toxin TcdB middle/N-terminal domain-containing protein [Candidatus Limnocylindrales bacterium]